jgi:nicotinate phosphoribosyltransferase
LIVGPVRKEQSMSPATPLPGAGAPATVALLTDKYELTMASAARAAGNADVPCVFEVYTRSLPPGRRYGVVAGTGRFLDLLDDFRFPPGIVTWLVESGVVSESMAPWLADYRFAGDIDGHREGEVFSPDTPVLTVRGSFAECVLLETLLLSVLNHDTAIASAAARMVVAAGDRPCLEMGSRRTHEAAAVAAARAAYIAGFAGTSNLEAGLRYGIPTIGTSAHAFTLLHRSEREAFEAQLACMGTETTLLVDTYDTLEGVRTAIEVAGPKLRAVRLDSGDFSELAHRVRALLDELGATDTRITVTSDLDEYAIAALTAAPVDAYGVGTSLVTGSGAPTAGFVYKLVERDGEPVAKRSLHKASRGGAKTVSRLYAADGTAVADVVRPAGHTAARPDRERLLSVPLVRGGAKVAETPLAEAREHRARSVAELPPQARVTSRGEVALDVIREGWGDALAAP